MYELLKAIATANSYNFVYGRSDFQNLADDMDTGLVYIFLDPVATDKTHDEFNNIDSKTYSGAFTLLVSSDIDKGDYEQRYLDEIKPLIDGALVVIELALKCGGTIDFNTWRELEVINLFDYNLDGLSITYNITENV